MKFWPLLFERNDAMRKIIEIIKSDWKKALKFAGVFAVVFLVLFLVVNMDLAPDEKKTFRTPDSFAGKLGEDFAKKMGSTDVYVLGYTEWAEYHNLNESNRNHDDDPDKDGLPNYLEYVHATNPTISDTDSDGYEDRQEIINGYDPDTPGDARPSVQLSIKKINVQAPMIWSKNEDEANFQEDLKHGIIHYPKTASPGQNGNVILSGHSSNYIWAEGNYNHVFKDLNSLEAGDEVDLKVIQKNGRAIVYHYKVSTKAVMSPDDPAIFINTDQPTLTLSTCWPLGTRFRRLIIKADLVK